MPAYGSKAVYAEPRDGLKAMKRKARSHGHFPRVGVSSEEQLYKELQQIQKGKEVNTVQQKMIAMDESMNYELETERMMDQLRQARVPGFRDEGARMMGADRVASQVLTGNYKLKLKNDSV